MSAPDSFNDLSDDRLVSEVFEILDSETGEPLKVSFTWRIECSDESKSTRTLVGLAWSDEEVDPDVTASPVSNL